MIQLLFLSNFQHHVDPAIGVYIIDRYTYYALEFLERVEPNSKRTIGEFVRIQRDFCIHLQFFFATQRIQY